MRKLDLILSAALFAAAAPLTLGACGATDDDLSPDAPVAAGKADVSSGGITLSLQRGCDGDYSTNDACARSQATYFRLSATFTGGSLSDPSVSASFRVGDTVFGTRALGLSSPMGNAATPHYLVAAPEQRATTRDCVAGARYYFNYGGKRYDRQYTATSYCGHAVVEAHRTFVPGSYEVQARLANRGTLLAQPRVAQAFTVVEDAQSSFDSVTLTASACNDVGCTSYQRLTLNSALADQTVTLPAGADHLWLRARAMGVTGTPPMSISTSGPGGVIDYDAIVDCSEGSGAARYCQVEQGVKGVQPLGATFVATFRVGDVQRIVRFRTSQQRCANGCTLYKKWNRVTYSSFRLHAVAGSHAAYECGRSGLGDGSVYPGLDRGECWECVGHGHPEADAAGWSKVGCAAFGILDW